MKILRYAAIIPMLAVPNLTLCEEPAGRQKPDPPNERAVSISAKPHFKEDRKNGYHTLEIEGADGKKSIFWPKDAPKPDLLDDSRSYTFDLLEEEMRFGRSTYWSPEIVKVREGGKLLFDASICSKHHIQMDRKLVGISYGLPSNTPELKTLAENAPNDGTVPGGCSVDTERAETWTWVCPKCKSIRDEAMVRMREESR